MAQNDADEQLGPIEFVAVEFPDGRVGEAGFDVLLDLERRGVIHILDVEFVTKGDDGTLAFTAPDALPAAAGTDLSVWDGASSGLLDADDLADIGGEMTPGGLAAVIVFENRWVTALIDSWRAGGARLIAEGGIPAADLVAALDATDPH
jgi:hypothetical protein